MATSDLTEQLLKLAAAPPTMASDAERQALMAACEKAKSSLETPLEATVRFMFGVRLHPFPPSVPASIRVLGHFIMPGLARCSELRSTDIPERISLPGS
jgi:hypothetical protein